MSISKQEEVHREIPKDRVLLNMSHGHMQASNPPQNNKDEVTIREVRVHRVGIKLVSWEGSELY